MMSQSAVSIAEMAAWLTPLRVNSVARYIATHSRSTSHAGWPVMLFPSHSIAAQTGAGVPIPSPSPTIPSSVVTRAKVHAVEPGVVGTRSVNASTDLMRSPFPDSVRYSATRDALPPPGAPNDAATCHSPLVNRSRGCYRMPSTRHSQQPPRRPDDTCDVDDLEQGCDDSHRDGIDMVATVLDPHVVAAAAQDRAALSALDT